MPVDTLHSDYQANIDDWLLCRHLVQGEREVKGHGALYLPMLSGQDTDQYNAYRKRAKFFNACDRTVEGLAGTVMAKLPSIKWISKDDTFLKSVGPNGESLQQMLLSSLEEDLTTGRMGVLVDAPDEEDNAGDNPPPYATIYFPENILNWKVEEIDGRLQPTLVVLKEMGEDEGAAGDEFTCKEVEQIRVLSLEGDGIESYQYRVRLYQKKPKKDGAQGEMEWMSVQDTYPTRWGGKPIDYLPFKFCNTTSTDDEVEKSPILDLANANLAHYRLSADYRHGLHYVAMPTIWAAGFDPATTKLKIGAESAWITKNQDAKCGMLEMTGAGLSSMKDALEDDKKDMAVLGARILEEQKAGVEAAATVQLRNASEKSVLGNVAASVSETWTTVLRWLAAWMGEDNKEVAVTLNQDYGTLQLDGMTMGQLLTSVQQGALSYEMWFYNLKQAQFIPDERTIEEEREAIAEGLPMPKLNPSDPANQVIPDPNNPDDPNAPPVKKPVKKTAPVKKKTKPKATTP